VSLSAGSGALRPRARKKIAADLLVEHQKVLDVEPQVTVVRRARTCRSFPRFPHDLDCMSEGRLERSSAVTSIFARGRSALGGIRTPNLLIRSSPGNAGVGRRLMCRDQHRSG
jgi:hypothetical protein